METTIAEKAELVLLAYEKHLDLEIAFLRNGVELSEQREILADSVFATRIALVDAELFEELITELRELAFTSDSGSVKLNAVKELGRMFYRKRFKDESGEEPFRVPDSIVLRGSEE